MEEFSFLSIIVPTYNKKGLLRKTIESLLEQSYPMDKYEIIIVDDGSTDGTGEWIRIQQERCICNVRYFFQKNRGPAAARNLGIKHARGETIAFIDSDCIASRTWLEEITKGYDNDRIAGIGGLIKPIPTNSRISQYCAYIKMNERPKIDKTGITFLITGNSSFRKDYLNAVGGFDERYTFPGGEDPDLCYRLKEKGYIFRYNRNAIVYNPHKQTLGELAKTYFNYGKGNTFLVLRKYSNWDLTTQYGVRCYFLFLKAIIKMIVMMIDNLKKLILGFLKIPFKMLLYYGKGLAIKKGLLYAFLDYVQVLSFQQGMFVAYLVGKFRGFKEPAVVRLFPDGYNTENCKK